MSSSSLPQTAGFKKKYQFVHLLCVKFQINQNHKCIIVQIFASCSENEAYVIDRYSSHPTENFIGIIRKLCDGDNGYEVIAYNLVRY